MFEAAPPVEKPVPVHDVALVELHVSVEEFPSVIVVGAAVSETVGAEPDAGATFNAFQAEQLSFSFDSVTAPVPSAHIRTWYEPAAKERVADTFAEEPAATVIPGLVQVSVLFPCTSKYCVKDGDAVALPPFVTVPVSVMLPAVPVAGEVLVAVRLAEVAQDASDGADAEHEPLQSIVP